MCPGGRSLGDHSLLCPHKENMGAFGFLTWRVALAAPDRVSRLSNLMLSWRWTLMTSVRCSQVRCYHSNLEKITWGHEIETCFNRDSVYIICVVSMAADVCFCCFREAEANNGLYVREASYQRRHDARHQTGETYGPHEQGQTVRSLQVEPHPRPFRPRLHTVGFQSHFTLNKMYLDYWCWCCVVSSARGRMRLTWTCSFMSNVHVNKLISSRPFWR